MWGLIACVAVACLAVASGALPSQTTVSLVTKNYNYDKKDIIFSRQTFANDDLVYAVCEGSGADKKCTLYLETANKEKSTVQKCDLNLKYEGKFFLTVALTNAGNSKAIFAVKDGETKLKLLSVNLKGCDIKEASVEVTEPAPKNDPHPININIVAHENNYDVIFCNEKLCHDNLCKATFGYDGKVVKAAASFPVEDIHGALYQIKSVKDIYLVSVTSSSEQIANVYFIDKDQKSTTLFSSKDAQAGLSVQENKFGFCAVASEKVLCKQYDIDGMTKKIEVSHDVGGDVVAVKVLNLEKGFLLLIVGIIKDTSDQMKRNAFLVRFDEEGKQQYYTNLDVKCDRTKLILPSLYKSSSGEYCVTSLCLTHLYHKEPIYDFTRNSKCFSHSELFN